MGKRAQLHGLVRNLRQYLEWQAVPLSGSVTAPAEERQAFETASRERAQEALDRKLNRPPSPAAPTPQPTPSFVPPVETSASASPAPKPQPQAPVGPPSFLTEKKKVAPPAPTPSGAALWKDEGLGARPRKTFEAPEPRADTAPARETLTAIRDELGDCKRCGLCEERTNIVFGVGNPNARIMFVGEAPGFNDDKQSEPFVGKAGELLDKMIVAMTLSREEVYIANVLKCRPPQNRDPLPEEVAMCGPFLERQVAAIQPEVIVAVGKFASNLLSGNDGALSLVRGEWQTWNGLPLMPTFHPAYLLRNPADKALAWNDLKLVMERLNIKIPEKYR